MGSPEPQGRQAKSKARMARFEELNTNDYQKRNETNEFHSARTAPRRQGGGVQANLCKSYGDRLLIDNLSFSIPKGRHRRHHRSERCR